jgi:biuret amidohydrolase
MTGSTFNRLANRMISGLAVAALRKQLTFDRSDTALLVVGAQRDLLDDAAAVSALARLISIARAGGLKVIYAVAAPPTSANGIHMPTPSQRALLAERLLSEGSAGAEFHPALAPGSGDVVLEPSAGLSAFSKRDLDLRLSMLGVERIVVAGARTDIEIDSTARDGVERGFQTTVVSDGCAGTTPQNHRATISTTLPRIVHGILTVDEVAARLTPTS